MGIHPPAGLGSRSPVERDARIALASLGARLHRALNGGAAAQPAEGTDVQGHPRLITTPPLNRASMAPQGWLRPYTHPAGRHGGPERPNAGRGHWGRAAAVRRAVLLSLVIAQTVIATGFMAEVLPYKGAKPLEMLVVGVFAILFAWISSGFWTALAGFGLLWAGRDRFAISKMSEAGVDLDSGPIHSRTAIIMPICNEDVGRVFAGLRATCESLVRTGQGKHFDFFVLSDTGDPDVRVAEVDAWLELRRALGEGVHVHYRWRQHRIKRKSGNVADFCRRWGRDYEYMVVLDADSVMTGDCLVRLARLMDADPGAGIIQTAPQAFGRASLFARIQQFATAAYGPLFTAGLHYWQLGEAHYWGHNAIIRVEPFMRHCALGRLPGAGALSGEILSHDFVEAALMRRAGWGVWIAYDLPGSYEEVPPNLIDELARDRRWCMGNLMNIRLLRLEGVHPAHRAVFMIGVMAYVSAPLWFLALALGTALLAQHTLGTTQYFTQPHQLFPTWPEWHPEKALALFGSTAIVLFLPKAISAVLLAARRAQAFGGALAAAASVAIETVFSALFAPIRMLFHTEFVVTGIAGITLRWKSPPRDDAETSWGQAFRRHIANTAIGLAWIALVWYMDPRVLPWILPVAGALALSIPLSVITSRVSLGSRAREWKLFLTPEESAPPEEIRRTLELAKAAPARPGLVEAVVDPLVNALACAQATARWHAQPPARTERDTLVHHALTLGLGALDRAQRNRLLNDPIALSALHHGAWNSPLAHATWVEARARTVESRTS